MTAYYNENDPYAAQWLRNLGEQVASKDGLRWLDLVSSDVEGEGYAFGAADLCAAGFQKAHIRQRLYFVGLANGDDQGRERRQGMPERADQRVVGSNSLVDGLADADLSGEHERTPSGEQPIRDERREVDPRGGLRYTRETPFDRGWFDHDWLLCRNPKGEPEWRPVEPGSFPLANGVANRMGKLRAYGNGLDAQTATGFVQSVMEIV